MGVPITGLVLHMKQLRHKVAKKPGGSHGSPEECCADGRAQWSGRTSHRWRELFVQGKEADSGFHSKFLSPLHFLSLGLHSSPTSTPGDQGYLTIVPSVISFLLPSSPSQPFQISLGNTHGGSGLVGGVQGTVNSGMWELPVMCHCCNYGPKWLFC